MNMKNKTILKTTNNQRIFVMIDRIMSELASVSLEVLKLRVLFVLYEAKEREGLLKVQEIRQRLGIPLVKGEPEGHASFVFGLLCYLEDEGKVKRFGGDPNHWIITVKGVSVIERER